jgi:hypothetical protein
MLVSSSTLFDLADWWWCWRAGRVIGETTGWTRNRALTIVPAVSSRPQSNFPSTLSSSSSRPSHHVQNPNLHRRDRRLRRLLLLRRRRRRLVAE